MITLANAKQHGKRFKSKIKFPPYSIAWKLFASTLSCLLVLLILIWLLNNYVLVSYYQNAKVNVLKDAFQKVNTLYSQDSDNLEDEVYRLSNSGNVRMTIWYRTTLIYDTRISNHFNDQDSIFLIPDISGWDYGTYEIGTRRDPRSESMNISLVGRFSNGYGVMMSTPVAAIEESVDITNRFLMITGGAALVIAAAVALFITRFFTKPIHELSRVAGSVSHLDFSDRYTRKGRDEFADLGRNINSMAAALEATVSDLKTANLQLMNDVEQKTRQNEARRAFISNVSHELKTPISLIQTYAEGLHEDIASSAENRDYYCGVIEDEANKMSTLIKKMTMLMQLEAGSEELVIERFDIAELLHNLILKNMPRFDSKQAAVFEPEYTPTFVWADEFLIENVLSNYLSNALNHVEPKGRIVSSLEHTEDGRIRVSLFNSGNNIPDDDLPKIWESFYKVDKARTRAYGGTGIGLSVVAAIMNAHHMPYGVINHEDGVEFYIELEER